MNPANRQTFLAYNSHSSNLADEFMLTSEPVQDKTPPTAIPFTRAQQLLLDFLRDHDASCPVCNYNLRGLTRPICPECKHDLALSVGVAKLRLLWLLIALVPSFFCGIAACLLAIPTTAVYFEDGIIVWPFVGAVLFGWCSGIFAIILVAKRNRFIAQSRTRQRWIVLLLMLIHFIAFVFFFGWMASQI